MIARYARPALVAVWSDATRFDTWLSVELAVCRAMERAGTVPAGTAAVVEAASRGKLDAARILEIEATTRHDVIAFLTHVEELAGAPARWLHLGMTSSDVLDTSLALQCVQALDQILVGVAALAASLGEKARAYANTPMIGRSHGMHAEPTAAGLTFARWRAELLRAQARVVAARHGIAVGKIAGAVGVYGNIEPTIEAEALGELGLAPETVATQIVARDRHAEVLGALALLGTAIEQMALGVRHWQRSEVGEAEEGFGKGQKGSSAMPHKKNPILSENLCGLARLLRSYAQAGLENVALWHERDISHSSVERMIAPDATVTLDFALDRLAGLVEKLVVYPERAEANLNKLGGLIFSQRVLLALTQKGMSREASYEAVQRNAMKVWLEGANFLHELKKDSDIGKHLTTDELCALFDMSYHTKHVDTIFARVFG